MPFINVNYLTKIVDLFLYGNFWIAIAAVAMTLQTQYLLQSRIACTPLLIFIFSSTLFLYALHRIVGLQKVKPFQDKGRYLVISTFKNHILIYAALGALGAFFSFWYLSLNVQIALVLPAILSLGYVIPILTGKRRFRDIHFIKIFLVALVWAYITVLLPILESNFPMDIALLPLFLERTCFIFAITLPFDIRDLKVDEYTAVKTIPSKLGIAYTKILAATLLIAMLFFAFLNILNGLPFSILVPLSISAFSTFFLIYYSDRVTHDYYFTGLIDGTMLLQFLLIYFFV